MRYLALAIVALVLVGCACGEGARRIVWQPIPQVERVQTTPMKTVQVPYAAPAFNCAPTYGPPRYTTPQVVPPTYSAPCP